MGDAPTLGYGLIGVGMMGQEHIKNLNLLRQDGDRVCVAAMSDPEPKSIAEAKELISKEEGQPMPAEYSDFGDLINDPNVHVLVISTPNVHHVEVLRLAIASGKHILVEKPMCTTPEHCLEVEELLRSSGKYGPDGSIYWVAMEYRYIRPITRMLEVADGGDVGKVRMVSIREHRYPFLIKVGNWNRFSANTGGTLVEKCCHFFDLMLRITGSAPVRVFASGAVDVNHQDETYDGAVPDIIDNAYVLVDFENGSRACLDLCMFAEASEHQEELCIVGDRGKVEAKVPVNEVTIGIRGTSPIDWIPPPEEERTLIKEEAHVSDRLLGAGYHEGSTYWEHKRLYEIINMPAGDAKRKPDVSMQDGLMSVMVGAAAEKSVREGRHVMLSELVPDNIRQHTAATVASRIARLNEAARLA
mmetsp:Transcript_40270/g.125990  ORF Transcript_40270/g.125990 Transcript_40270/m.125990 type:complete len:415 (+) Transcript_40270:233-1477(+)